MMRNKTIPPTMQESLALTPETVTSALLIRHSIRYPIPPGDGAGVPLTPEGIQIAEQWGRQMGRPVRDVFSSSIGRCVETGRAILRGMGRELVVHEEPMFLTGFVENPDLAWPIFREHNHDPFRIINWLLQGVPVPGMFPIRQGSDRIMTFICDRLTDTGAQMNLYITHDSVLAPVVYHFLGRETVDAEDWPWMLEGAFFWKEADQFFMAWRGQVYKWG